MSSGSAAGRGVKRKRSQLTVVAAPTQPLQSVSVPVAAASATAAAGAASATAAAAAGAASASASASVLATPEQQEHSVLARNKLKMAIKRRFAKFQAEVMNLVDAHYASSARVATDAVTPAETTETKEGNKSKRRKLLVSKPPAGAQVAEELVRIEGHKVLIKWRGVKKCTWEPLDKWLAWEPVQIALDVAATAAAVEAAEASEVASADVSAPVGSGSGSGSGSGTGSSLREPRVMPAIVGKPGLSLH